MNTRRSKKPTVQQNTSTDASSTPTIPTTPPESTSSPNWPLFDKDDDTLPKGLQYFRAKTSNILNFHLLEADTTWKHAFRGSEILAWKDNDDHKGGLDLFLIGRLGKSTLKNALSEFNDPAYRLDLILDGDTAAALWTILNNGPLRNMNDINYPILGRTARFSAKLKTLQKSDAPNLDADDSFPFLFDGREMAKGKKTLLKAFPAAQLSDNDMVAVETNISSYDIPAKLDSPERMGYSLSLRCIYFLSRNPANTDDSGTTSPKNLKRQGDNLVSPRKNKKAGQLAVFSDEE